MTTEMTTACMTSPFASARRPPPSARATAEATPPPIPPADIVCMSMMIGNTSETPASASGPRCPTQYASAVVRSACIIITATFGAASRSSVGAMAPSSSTRVREAIGRAAVTTAAMSLGMPGALSEMPAAP